MVSQSHAESLNGDVHPHWLPETDERSTKSPKPGLEPFAVRLLLIGWRVRLPTNFRRRCAKAAER